MEKARYVLYVDDDPDDREIFSYALANCNADISLTTAQDGYDALEKLASLQRPCCIYLDINMPKMDGIQLLKILKSHRDFELIPVIIFSTAMDSRSKREAMDLGALDAYRKPTSLEGLLEVLNASISKHAGSPQSPINSIMADKLISWSPSAPGATCAERGDTAILHIQ